MLHRDRGMRPHPGRAGQSAWRSVAMLLLLGGCDSEPSGGDGLDQAAVLDGAADGGAADGGPDGAPDGALDAGALDASADAGGPTCGSYTPATETGTLSDPQLTEVSGIAASRRTPGVLWLHNDSGDAPLLYATGENGRAFGRLRLPVAADDLEDIAAAPCPGTQDACLWIGDIGDNTLSRPSIQVHAVREPAVEGPFAEQPAEIVQTFTVRYPDGRPADAEALAVSPTGDRFYLFTKGGDTEPRVFSWETAQPGPGALTDHGPFAPPGVAVPMGKLITGADLHPDGRRLAVRVYTGSYEYRFAPGQDVADLGAVAATLVTLGPLSEPQGEAIAYAADGQSLWTVSEDAAGGQPLHQYLCR